MTFWYVLLGCVRSTKIYNYIHTATALHDSSKGQDEKGIQPEETAQIQQQLCMMIHKEMTMIAQHCSDSLKIQTCALGIRHFIIRNTRVRMSYTSTVLTFIL